MANVLASGARKGATGEREPSRRVDHRRRPRHRSRDSPPIRPRRLLSCDARPEPRDTGLARTSDRALARLCLRRDRRSAARCHDRASARGAWRAEGLIHNAVGGAFGTFLEIEPEVLNRNFQVNTMALLHLARRLAPAMIDAGEGAIIVTGN